MGCDYAWLRQGAGQCSQAHCALLFPVLFGFPNDSRVSLMKTQQSSTLE